MPILASDDAPDIHTSRVQLAPRKNPDARTFAIGDIHGCSHALDLMLQELSLSKDDTLITLGDYVDRGPDTRGVIDRLLALEQRVHLVPLMGNHEILMLDAQEGTLDTGSWFSVGGRQTMASYGAEGTEWDKVPASHWEFFKRLRRWHLTEGHIYAHANVNAMLPMSEQSDDWLFWRRFDDSHPHFSGKLLVCGHTAQKSGVPVILPGRICIDTWAYGDGWLTALEVGGDTFVQTSQRGEVRRLSFAEVDLLAQKA